MPVWQNIKEEFANIKDLLKGGWGGGTGREKGKGGYWPELL